MAKRLSIHWLAPILFAVLSACGTANVSPDRAQLAKLAPPGRMVRVGGHRVYLNCVGAGAPTVVLEAGLGQASLNWAWVQRDLATAFRVCSYDRPGYGLSDPVDEPMDADHVSQDLGALLRAAGEKGPFVVVGHSLGGVYARRFVDRNRQAVVGLVLLDATNPAAIDSLAEVGLPSPDQKPALVAAAKSDVLWSMMTHAGLRTVVGTAPEQFPPDIAPAMRVFIPSSDRARAAIKEGEFVTTSVNQIRSLAKLGDMPLLVVAADRWDDPDPKLAAQRGAWDRREQQTWLTLSTHSRFEVVPGSDHLSLLSNQAHAHAIAAAIRAMIVGGSARQPSVPNP